MAAAAGTSLLRSVATKMGMTVAPRALSLHHHPFLLDGLRGRRPGPTSSRHPFSSSSSAPSGSTPPPTNNKDLTQNKNVSGKLYSAKPSMPAIVAGFMLCGAAAFLSFWVQPRLEEVRDKTNALLRERKALLTERDALLTERSILIKAVEECQRTHIKAQDVLADSSQVQSMQALGENENALKVIAELLERKDKRIKDLEEDLEIEQKVTKSYKETIERRHDQISKIEAATKANSKASSQKEQD